ncbi:DUF3006 domain-containing protein [Viridibacillus sp. YIM B01967]|uniref:DUF3006 domain-containing protein n=2 Tax=Viridibacillus soli TaxID=2798301 RepID=A0ABS1H450_9BACL|nr:DUF3006 domain-containing protein [Viridibacillus soli]
MKTGIIDRFEGQIAVVEFEDGMQDIVISELPKGVQPGDVLIFHQGKITIDSTTRKKLEVEIRDLMDDLFED